MANIAMAEDAYLKAQARFKTWQASFELEWNKPLQEMMLLAFWHKMSPDQHQYFAVNHPEAYQKMAQWVEEITRKPEER